MMNDKQIPGLDQSWSSAEKMLNSHFRKRRWTIIFFSLIVPALLVGVAFLIQSNKSQEKNTSNGLSEKSSVISNVQPAKESLPEVSVNSINNKSIPLTTSSQTNSGKIPSENSSINNQQNSVSGSTTIGGIALKNSIRSRRTASSTLSPANNSYASDNTSASDNSSSETGTSLRLKEELSFADFISSGFVPFNKKDVSVHGEFPASSRKPCNNRIGLEATVYGGAMYVQKSLSAEASDGNYLQHRKNEEDPVIMPTFGISLSANLNAWALSIGAEYSVYGEKTNYYPYSNQENITDNSYWQFYLTNYVDTDTAYIMGNQLFLNTLLQRQDSSHVSDSDTTYEYRYDKNIAENNGYNKFYYFEFPVEISYALTKGRLGFGVSGGVAPAVLVHEKGNYIRSDGTGLDSFEEIKYFRKIMVNARVSADFYYRISPRMKLVMRPQLRSNLNSVFNSDSRIRQKYYSTGVLFGVSYFLN